QDAGLAVARDDVGGRGRGAADGVVEGVVDLDALEAVAHGGGGGDVGADVVALHLIVERAGDPEVADEHAVAAVAGDEVAGAGELSAGVGARGTAHQVVVGGVEDRHAREVVPQRGGAGGVGADEVALHHVAA